MMETEDLNERDELLALLPFYVSGRIEPSDKARVEAWLNKDPQADAILAKVREEQQVSAALHEAIPLPKGGLERLMGDVAATSQDKTASGLWASFLRWLNQGVVAPLRAAPSELAWAACGLLLIVSTAQTVLLSQKGGHETGGGYVLASGERYEFIGKGLVTFATTAPMDQVMALMDQAGAVIVDGPTASGHFVIGFIKRDEAGALQEREALLRKRADLIVFFARQSFQPASE